MRIIVPRAICRFSTWPRHWPHLRNPFGGVDITPERRVEQALAIAQLDSIQNVEFDGSSFYCTEHKPINDCVHSKIVDADGEISMKPIMKDLDGYAYTPYWKDYTQQTWVSDPFISVLEPVVENDVPTRLVYQDRTFCIIIDLSFTTYNGGYSWCALHIQYHKAVPRSLPRFQNPYRLWRDVEGKVQLEWFVAGEASKLTNFYPVACRYTGRTQGMDPVYMPQEILDLYGHTLEGITGTFRGNSRYYYLSGVANLMESLFSKLLDFAKTYHRFGETSNWSGWREMYWYTNTELVLPEYLPPNQRFLLHEDEVIRDHIDPLLIDRHGLPNYWRNVLIQNAYLDALDSVPRLNDNSISNILEIASFIKSLVIDHRIDIPKSLGDAWLSYRYVYTTGKLDAEEAIKFVKRHRDLGTLDRTLKCYGRYTIDYTVDDISTVITCRCGLFCRPKDIATLGKIWRALYTYGLQPNFYVVWDMIPYSFIVDWLIPVGNIMHALDASSMYDGTYYNISDLCFSISYDIVDDLGITYHQYTRWWQKDVPQLRGFYFFEEEPKSTKVIGMRALDTASLFIG